METKTVPYAGFANRPQPDEPICGDMATAILLRKILAELQKLNANLTPKKSKVETR